ncbi:MAG: cell cycle protein [Fluviicola sp.]|jgi:rod shape determining protein RodA|uniref:rod shape-determining protein RodA n=1 Tax=Fluviicola sp. TaxID=1917219 RepID=UPI00261B3231|nr:rod shape-determining protein RodA [Fluviicola sp.]MDF3027940.1 cell cycle protein [Fluviicola sp.]
MRRDDSLTQHVDWWLLSIVVIMLGMGIANVYSAAYDPDHPNIFDFSQKYGKQIMWVGISIFLGFLVFLIDSDIYRKFAIPIYLFCFSLLVVVLFTPPINGARAWLGIGTMGIQPAEFMKIGTAIVLSRYISTVNVKNQNVQTVFIALAIVMVPMVMILLQPDAGTFVVFTSFFFVLYREGITFDPLVLKLVNAIPGVRFKETWVGSHFIPILFYVVFLSIVTLLMSGNKYEFTFMRGVLIPGFYGVITVITLIALIAYLILRWISSRRDQRRVLLIIVTGWFLSVAVSTTVNFSFSSLAPHQKDRIELVLGLRKDDDGKDYNRNRAMAAVGSGGLFGKGYKKASVASVRSNHVPESETDFIFCPLAEEWGFMGSLVIVGLFMGMLFRIIVIAERQRSTFNRVYAYCVAMIVFYHFAVNIGMNIGLAPVIGIPLPFFSYGGSSLMSFSMLLFILLKLDSQRRDVLF